MKIALVVLLCITGSAYISADSGWQLDSNKNGIETYTRHVAGSNVDAVKAVCTLHSSLSGLAAMMMDVKSYPNWVYHCGHTEVLKTIGPLELVYHQVTTVPWPASNRDLVAELKIVQDPHTGVIVETVENLPDYIPEKAGIVRLQKFRERVTIIPKGKDCEEMSYEMEMDAGGDIPSWMVNRAIGSGPYESMSALSRLIDKGAYQDIRYPYIREVY